MAAPLVSILIPTYRRPAYVFEAIQSCQRQTYPELEILVGDDASEDETEAVVRRLMAIDRRIQFFPRAKNVGQARVRNALWEHASGDYIQFLDDDDLLHAEKIRLSVEALESDPEAGVAASQTTFFLNVPGDSTHIWNRLLHGDTLIRFLRHDMPWVTVGPLWRASALRDTKLVFDTRIQHSDDLLHSTRALIRGMKPILLPYVLNYYRRQTGFKVSQVGRSTRVLMHQRCFEFFEEDLQANGRWNEATQLELGRNYRWNVSRAIEQGQPELAVTAARCALRLCHEPEVHDLLHEFLEAAEAGVADLKPFEQRNERLGYDRETRENWWGRFHLPDEPLQTPPRARRYGRESRA